MTFLRNRISVGPPITTNVGASSGPRISTASFSWFAKYIGAGELHIQMFADLDGGLWQDDWDVSRRGAQALVPFSKRAAAAMRDARAEIVLEQQARDQTWYSLTVAYEDSPEGYVRRIRCHVSFPMVSPRSAREDEQRRKWLEQISQCTLEMGTNLHMSLHDEMSRSVFYGDKA